MKKEIKIIAIAVLFLLMWSIHGLITDYFGAFVSWQYWISVFLLGLPPIIIMIEGIKKTFDL